MCATCGCSSEHALDRDPAHPHGAHDHGPDHAHAHAVPPETPQTSTAGGDGRKPRLIALERDVLARNDHLAAHNRGWLAGRGVFAINLMGSPGAGKTALLEATVRVLDGRATVDVVEGDQATAHDAERMRAAGERALQINTGTTCHLDAAMIGRALAELDPAPATLLAIENVGNLVCPALFDLGEHARVVVVSVTEGDDKPEKYPHMFRAADVLVLNKLDLLPHVRFDVERCLARALELNPHLRVFRTAATRGDGLEPWCAWLLEGARGAGAQATRAATTA
jgi:hydrogenase nickel incorporation protein HypB